jgi:2-oxoglutarate dehydrogenase E1 component
MSPKSLLRHRAAVSPVKALVEGRFEPLLDDVTVHDRESVRRVLLVSGKFYYTLLEARDERSIEDTALVRLEQMYPFPRGELRELLEQYPAARDIRWVQEEPENMGAWRGIRHRIEASLPDAATLRHATRASAASPATGYYLKHVEQEKTLLDLAFGDADGIQADARRPVRKALR